MFEIKERAQCFTIKTARSVESKWLTLVSSENFLKTSTYVFRNFFTVSGFVGIFAPEISKRPLYFFGWVLELY